MKSFHVFFVRLVVIEKDHMLQVGGLRELGEDLLSHGMVEDQVRLGCSVKLMNNLLELCHAFPLIFLILEIELDLNSVLNFS